jgi:hypothetical protein
VVRPLAGQKPLPLLGELRDLVHHILRHTCDPPLKVLRLILALNTI